MSYMRSKPRRKKRASNTVEAKMVRNLDALAKFEHFASELLPALQKAVLDRKPSKDILEIADRYAAARIAHIVASTDSPSVALSAAKDILDRTQGKAIERKEFKHQLSQLKEEELDALLESKIKDVESTE